MKFQRELLNWLSPFLILPSVHEIRDEMQAIYKELTSDGLSPRSLKEEEEVKTRENAWKIFHQ